MRVSCHSSRYNTITCDWAVFNKENHVLDISFACLVTANLHYGAFKELVESPSSSGLVFCSVAITHYRWYGKLVEGSNLATTFKDHKKGGINIDRKKGEVESNGEEAEDDEGDNEDSAMDTKSVIDSYANVVNSGEADKGVKDTSSTLPNVVGKRVGDANKGV